MSDTDPGHPTLERLSAFAGGGLDEAGHAAVGAHVAGCPVCWDRLERLGDEDSFLRRLREAQGSGTPSSPRDLPPTGLAEVATTADLGGPDRASQGHGTAPELPAIPGFELLGVVGRGGMGVVYKARQVALNRVVALKMVLAGSHAGAEELSRFRTEAEAVARLQHPNIVQIYEVGEHEGKPFFAMEYCPGGSLEKRLRGTPLPPRDAARFTRTLAEAMQVAHQARVVHRDLKPANILLQKSEVRSQKSEVRSQRSEVRGPKSEVRGWKGRCCSL